MATTIGGAAPRANEYDLKEILAKEFGELKTELKREIQEVKTEIQEVKTELKHEIQEVKTEFEQRFDHIDQEIKEIKGELKDINGKINNLTVGQAKLETEITFIKSDVSSLKTNQNAQIWVLIVTLFGAVVKFGFFPNP